MNKNINLYKILKGREGETFYSHSYGEVIFSRVCQSRLIFFKQRRSKTINETEFAVSFGGKIHGDGEIDIFPSKDQRDWNKWIEEQNNKIPKTWIELVKLHKHISCGIVINIHGICAGDDAPIEKSALALLKIHQLIEVGYGGNKIDNDDIYYDNWTIDPHGFCPVRNDFGVKHILFHTKEQAEEFLSYPENVQLLKDYFMI